MAAAEMADYLDAIAPDYNEFFVVCPQDVITEIATGDDAILEGYDQSEERIGFADVPEFFVSLIFEILSESDAGTILDFYCNSAKAKRTTRSFKWAHPTDGHEYVVRFASNLDRDIAAGKIMAVQNIQLKILGVPV